MTTTSQLRGTRVDHPAPHRGRVAGWALSAALLVPPLAWLVQLLVSYGVASRSCFPKSVPLETPLLPGAGVSLSLVNAVSLLLVAAMAAAAFSFWRATREEAEGGSGTAIERGEGRTRFLAIWALLGSGGFFIALMFDTAAVTMAKLCGG